jgi:hypothetical protein
MNARAFAALLLSLLAVSAFAGEATLTRIATPEGAPRTVAEAVQRLRAGGVRVTARSAKSVRRPGRIRPNVIELETADSAFLIPAAGSVQGSNGTNITWSAYASSVDNLTGDGWVSRATQ